MDIHNTEKLVADAEIALNKGECEAAYKLIEPLLAEDNPGALFIYSHFSFAGSETEEEFDKRRIEMLKRAADQGYGPAIYTLGTCYEIGDLVEADPIYAAELLRIAAEMGYSKAKFRHGLNLYYGSNGMPKNESKGLELIHAAANAGVEEASEYLNHQGMN
jgi:TPR repeat protein